MKVTGSHLIVQALRAEGIDQIFTLAGDHTLHLMDVMAEESFKFIDTRHEQAAVDMANAWGRITGSPRNIHVYFAGACERYPRTGVGVPHGIAGHQHYRVPQRRTNWDGESRNKRSIRLGWRNRLQKGHGLSPIRIGSQSFSHALSAPP